MKVFKRIQLSLLLVILLPGFNAVAQQTSDVKDSLQELSTGEIYSFYENSWMSNSIHSGFVWSVLRGNTIDAELKKSVHPSKENVLFSPSGMGVGFDYHMKADSSFSRNSFGFEWADKKYIGVVFPHDYFPFIMMGNQGFMGETAHLSNARLEQIAYQELEFHWSHSRKFKGKRIIISVEPSLLKVSRADVLQIDDLEVSTAPYGEQIDVLANYSYSYGSVSFLNRQGIGFGLDASLELADPEALWSFRAYMEDAGWAQIKGNLQQVDTMVSFLGQEIEFIPGFQWPETSTLNSDSVLNKLDGETKADQKFPLSIPARFGLVYARNLNTNTRWVSSLEILPQYNSFYFIQTALQRKFSNSVSAGATVGYIDSGSAFLLINAEFSLYGKLSLQLNMGDVLSVIVPNHSFTQQVGINLRYRL